MKSLWPMLKKEFIQLRRDRFTFAMMVGIPALQLALFGYAIQMEVRHQPLVVLDHARTAESRALVHTMINTGNFDFAGTVADDAALKARIESGEAKAGLVIPAGWSRDLARGQGAVAQIIVDASDPLSANGAMAAAAQAALARSQVLLAGRTGGRAPIEVRVRPWYNPGVRSAVYIVPGIVGVLLSLTMVLIASMAVVRERECGTLEQLVVTPIGKTELMLGKTLPFLLVGYIQMIVVLLLGRLMFDVPFAGSLSLLLLVSLPFIVASLGVGLLISTLVKTQAQAIQLGFFYLMPNILLSGFMFPKEAMPLPVQLLAALLPLTWFLEVLRGILLRGVGLEVLWDETVILVLFAVGLLAISTLKFRKGLE